MLPTVLIDDLDFMPTAYYAPANLGLATRLWCLAEFGYKWGRIRTVESLLQIRADGSRTRRLPRIA